jgi:hydroxymethylpyrimidine/phosphomethylpyrimidine kinase
VENNQFYKVLSIAGFDGSGGAGIQADLKTFSSLGCYGTTALTAIPIQNTLGVRSIYDITTACIEEQIKAILDDMQMNAVKIGMLHRQEIIDSVAQILSQYNVTNIVLDPVMIAKSGDRLLLPEAIAMMKKSLFPITTVLTPNLLEASELLGREIKTRDQMEEAAIDLLEMGPQAVVVKGGHLKGNCDDCLTLKNPKVNIHWLSGPRIQTKNTHGTGCTFSAAIASFLAMDFTILDAVTKAKAYLTTSIEAGANMKTGQGNGPVHHFHHLWNFLSSQKREDK